MSWRDRKWRLHRTALSPGDRGANNAHDLEALSAVTIPSSQEGNDRRHSSNDFMPYRRGQVLSTASHESSAIYSVHNPPL